MRKTKTKKSRKVKKSKKVEKQTKTKTSPCKCKLSNIDSNNIGIFSCSKIVYDNGNISAKNYNSTSDTMYQIASCSKFITAIVVAKLYELGKLDYDTDINKYLKKWKCPKKGITLKQLLTHTSGSSDRNGYLGMFPQYPLTQDLDLNIKIINGNLYSKPFNITEKKGSKFMYSGAGFQVIQQVLEEITNERLYILMEKYIFTPLNMKNSTGKLLYEGQHNYSLADMDGLYRIHPETSAGGVWMSCNDLLTLALDLMTSYNDNSGKILQQETMKLITKGVVQPDLNKKHIKWGLGMLVVNEDEEGIHRFEHCGHNEGDKMNFYCIPEKKYVNIYMLNYNPKYYYNPKYKVSDKVKQILDI
jgi:CubicO group peptidase (beta-lactamase class C family)